MEAQLLLTRNKYEIWVDGRWIRNVVKNISDDETTYKKRAEAEFGYYCDRLKKIKHGVLDSVEIKKEEI